MHTTGQRTVTTLFSGITNLANGLGSTVTQGLGKETHRVYWMWCKTEQALFMERLQISRPGFGSEVAIGCANPNPAFLSVIKNHKNEGIHYLATTLYTMATYRFLIQSIVSDLDKIYDKTGALRDFATDGEKQIFNDTRGAITTLLSGWNKLDDAITEARAKQETPWDEDWK